MNYLWLGAIVFGVNLLPAFGPPTWSLLVVAQWQWNLNPFLIVPLAVVASSSGRTVLALSARHLRRRIPVKYRQNLDAIQIRLREHRAGTLAWYALFLISPLPSAQLFCAVGLIETPLLPVVLSFAVGRTVSYSLYVATATATKEQLRSVLGQFWGSPWFISLQVVLLVVLVLLPLAPQKSWRRHR
jgi:membrane protein YqaA with SNARE-associated domain